MSALAWCPWCRDDASANGARVSAVAAPRGAGGCALTPWDGGGWECAECGARAPRQAWAQAQRWQEASDALARLAAAAQAMADAATPGPWRVEHGRTYDTTTGAVASTEAFVRRPDDDVAIAADIVDPATGLHSDANAALIAAAPDLARHLVAAVDALRAERDLAAKLRQSWGASFNSLSDLRTAVIGLANGAVLPPPGVLDERHGTNAADALRTLDALRAERDRRDAERLAIADALELQPIATHEQCVSAARVLSGALTNALDTLGAQSRLLEGKHTPEDGVSLLVSAVLGFADDAPNSAEFRGTWLARRFHLTVQWADGQTPGEMLTEMQGERDAAIARATAAEAQRDALAAAVREVGGLIAEHGCSCDCDCTHTTGEHTSACDPCLACRASDVVSPLLRGAAAPVVRAEVAPPCAPSTCRSDDDGDCRWSRCPQRLDGEPWITGRVCPLIKED